MRHLFILVAALMLVTVAFTAPAQAQQRSAQKQQRPHQQPRAFSNEFKHQVTRSARSRAQTSKARPRTINPRYYNSNAAFRQGERLRYRTRRAANRTRARANISPRRIQPRFYNMQSAARASHRLRGSHKRAAKARRAALRRPRPTFWKN